MDMREILARVDARQAELKWTDRKISIEAGLSDDAIRNWRRRVARGETGGANVRSLEAVAKTLGVSTEWLVSGEGAMAGLPSDDLADVRRIAAYDIDASAGHGAIVAGDEPLYRVSFPAEMLQNITRAPEDALAMLRVRGDSMLPTLMDGDMMMVDTTRRSLTEDGIFILRYDDTLRVKRIDMNPQSGRVIVKSDNPIYETFEVAPDSLTVMGRVVWIGRRM